MQGDADTAQKIARGDTAAFNAFYRETAPRLLAFLRQIAGTREAAEDIMQETYTHLWRNPAGFDPERGSLRGYLYGMARKRAADWWRKRKPEEQLADTRTYVPNVDADCVSDALSRLPEEQQSLLWLREVEGLSYAELAVVLNIPVGTVRSRLFTAREALRAVWYSRPLAGKEKP